MIFRGSVYYAAQPVSDADLKLMRRIDELHLELPFAGARMLRYLLRGFAYLAAVIEPVVMDPVPLSKMIVRKRRQWLALAIALLAVRNADHEGQERLPTRADRSAMVRLRGKTP